MYCSKCGIRLPDNANFCMNCGARVEHFMQPNNMMEYYRSVINFTYTRVDTSENFWFNRKDGHSVVYLKAFDERGCALYDFDYVRVFGDYYEDISCFISRTGKEFFKIKRNSKWGLRTKERVFVDFLYDEISFTSMGFALDGFVCVKRDNLYGFLQLDTGNTVFDCSFDRLGNTCVGWPDDCFTISKDKRWGVISLKRGVVLRPFVYGEEYEVLANNPRLWV